MMTKEDIWYKRLDPLLLGCVFLLIGIGLLGIYSATYFSETASIREHFDRQIIWIGLGVLCIIGIWQFPVRFFYGFAYPLYGMSLVMLIAVLFIGVERSGGQRWLDIGGLQLQPSEIVKVTMVLALARYLSDYRIVDRQLRNFIIAACMVLVPTMLIFKQPDLGTSLVFPAVFIPMLFWAGIPWFTLFILIAPLVTILSVSLSTVYFFLGWMILMTMILYFARKPHIVSIAIYAVNIIIGLLAPFLWERLKDYQQRRILAFLNPEMDPRGAGYQILQSQTAIGSGGLVGKGYLEGTQTHLRFLPAQHTDFVFSVFGEEFGFIGLSIILLIFAALILRGIWIAALCKNQFAGLVAFGVTSILLIHILVNIGMAIGLLPVTGTPLPFLSYGGSFMIMTMMAVGLLLNIYSRRLQY